MADETKNEELRRDTQSGKMDPPMKKKKGFKIVGTTCIDELCSPIGPCV